MSEPDRAQYSVCQFFDDGQYEYEVRHVSDEEAAKRFNAIRRSVGAQIGTTVRVIITDGGDSICAEWEHGKGITWPTPEAAQIPGDARN